MRRTRATYLVRASLGRGIGKKKGGRKKKKKKSISVYHTRPWEHTLLTLLATATCWCHRGRVFPGGLTLHGLPFLQDPSQLLATPPAAGPAATGHRGLAWDRATRALNPPGALRHQPGVSWRAESCCPSPGACSRAAEALPATLGQHHPSAQLFFRRTFPPVGKPCHTARGGQPGTREQLQAL